VIDKYLYILSHEALLINDTNYIHISHDIDVQCFGHLPDVA